jgi:hypothetical protein
MPVFEFLKRHIPSSFFVIEAKISNFLERIPQAIYGLYKVGRLLQ